MGRCPGGFCLPLVARIISEETGVPLEEVKKAGKPLAASMGDMAASGGYYIACGADRIFAEPTTLTGSIGVFGVIPCIETLVEDKIGITQSIVKTNENTEFPLISKKMTPMQRASMQRMVNETYELFVARCATGRHTTCDSIKSIAEGRVWDGISAKEIGLVDEFGNTQAAIKWVANQAGISDYDIITGPDENFKLSNYIFQYMETRVENRLESEANPLYKYHKENPQNLAMPYFSVCSGFFHRLANNPSDPTLPQSPYYTDKNLELNEKIKALMAKYHASLSQIILGFYTAADFNVIPLYGSGKIEFVKDAVGYTNFDFAPEDFVF